MAKIGVQAMMLKDSFQEMGAFETLRKVSELGYSAVEISQIPMDSHNVSELGRAQDELGMEIASLSVMIEKPSSGPGESLREDFAKIVDNARLLGSKLVRIGMLPHASMRSLTGVIDFAKEANDYALALKAEGIELYYHNHHIEFAKYQGKLMLDIINENSPDMGLEIDVHWVARGGKDPVRTLRKYAANTAMVHLKDYRIATLDEGAFALLDAGDTAGFQERYRNVVQFAEVGQGNLDFPSIIETSQTIGAKYLLVEQDELYGRTVWEALALSQKNLAAMGFSHLF